MSGGDDLRIIGKRIKQIREARGLSQGHLALDAVMSRNSVSRIETGRSAYPADLLERLAKALHCDVAEFFRPLDAPVPRQRLPHHRMFQGLRRRYLDILAVASVGVGVDLHRCRLHRKP